MRKREFRKKSCFFDAKHVEPDYKDDRLLRRFISERGKIVPRRLTGTCPKHQRAIAIAIKRARHLALIPFVAVNMK